MKSVFTWRLGNGGSVGLGSCTTDACLGGIRFIYPFFFDFVGAASGWNDAAGAGTAWRGWEM